MRYLRFLAVLMLFNTTGVLIAQSRDIELNVAVFAYLPDASTAIERLEDKFEQQYSRIDLDLELWNPYDDAIEDDGMAQIVDFDIVEIDACRIDQLMNGAFGGLDKIPPEIQGAPTAYVGPAKAVMDTNVKEFLCPHWVCGNFLQTRVSNTAVVNATTFEEFLTAVDPVNKPVLAAMWGSTGLGEYYADAYLDVHGPQDTRQHLVALSKSEAEIDTDAVRAVLALVKELTHENQENLSHYYDHSYFFPRQYAGMQTATLIGYSERLYYTERELQLTPKNYPPVLKPEDFVIKQFSFGANSQGTPSWIDGFVIPKGRLAEKHAAIVAFLKFIQGEDAYLAFAEPAPYFAPSYLLPAVASVYDEDSEVVEKQPMLPKFQAALSDAFPVADSNVWQGMRMAGSRLKEMIDP